MGEVETKRVYIYRFFLTNPDLSIAEISQLTGIPRSSVQRYLKHYSYEIIPGRGISIEKQLEKNMLEGRRRGGINSFKKNDFKKDSDGHFTGSNPTSLDYDKEEKKKRDILIICDYFLDHYPITLDEMVEELEGVYTKSYIYSCLHDNRLVEVLGVDKSRLLIEKISSVRKDTYKRKKGNSI